MSNKTNAEIQEALDSEEGTHHHEVAGWCQLLLNRLEEVRTVQRYGAEPWGHTRQGVHFVKADDGGVVLHKDITKALESEDD